MTTETKRIYQQIISDIASINDPKLRLAETMTRAPKLAGLLMLDDADTRGTAATYDALFYKDYDNILLKLIGLWMSEKRGVTESETLEHFISAKIKNLATAYWLPEIKFDVEEAREELKKSRSDIDSLGDYHETMFNHFKLYKQL